MCHYGNFSNDTSYEHMSKFCHGWRMRSSIGQNHGFSCQQLVMKYCHGWLKLGCKSVIPPEKNYKEWQIMLGLLLVCIIYKPTLFNIRSWCCRLWYLYWIENSVHLKDFQPRRMRWVSHSSMTSSTRIVYYYHGWCITILSGVGLLNGTTNPATIFLN